MSQIEHLAGKEMFLATSIHADKVRIRLTNKIALCVNGVALTHLRVGDIMELDYGDARIDDQLLLCADCPLDTPLTHPIFPPIPAGPLGKLTAQSLLTIHLMVVKIIKQPSGTIDGSRLDRYHIGQSYDVPPTLADYLVLQGCAVVEMRSTHRSRFPSDRRQHPRYPSTKGS